MPAPEAGAVHEIGATRRPSIRLLGEAQRRPEVRLMSRLSSSREFGEAESSTEEDARLSRGPLHCNRLDVRCATGPASYTGSQE